jgi:hypothetical protein
LRNAASSTEHPEHATVDERGEDPLGGHHLVGVPLEGVHHEGDRHQEAAEQDDGGHQVGVAGREGDHHTGDPQQQTNQEEAQPLAVVALAGPCSDSDRLVRHRRLLARISQHHLRPADSRQAGIAPVRPGGPTNHQPITAPARRA